MGVRSATDEATSTFSPAGSLPADVDITATSLADSPVLLFVDADPIDDGDSISANSNRV